MASDAGMMMVSSPKMPTLELKQPSSAESALAEFMALTNVQPKPEGLEVTVMVAALIKGAANSTYKALQIANILGVIVCTMSQLLKFWGGEAKSTPNNVN